MSFKPYTEKIGICSILGRIRIRVRFWIRIRVRFWIRIRPKIEQIPNSIIPEADPRIRICGSGSASKWYGSETLVKSKLSRLFLRFPSPLGLRPLLLFLALLASKRMSSSSSVSVSVDNMSDGASRPVNSISPSLRRNPGKIYLFLPNFYSLFDFMTF